MENGNYFKLTLENKLRLKIIEILRNQKKCKIVKQNIFLKLGSASTITDLNFPCVSSILESHPLNLLVSQQNLKILSYRLIMNNNLNNQCQTPYQCQLLVIAPLIIALTYSIMIILYGRWVKNGFHCIYCRLLMESSEKKTKIGQLMLLFL